jgi:nicotinate-nucleotide adenylyltransferase
MTAFDRWKDYDKIISAFELYIYPRKIAEPIPKLFLNHPKIHLTDAPTIEISSSEIRQGIENGEDLSAWVPPASWNYLTEKNLYQ